jgi:hypothetical protein
MATTAKKTEAVTLNLVQKIAAIMTTITATFKGETAGSGSYGYKFISINTMIDIARPKLAEAGIIFYGDVVDREIEHGLGKNNNQTFVYLSVRWFVRDGDEEFSFVTLGEASDTGDKAANKAFTAAQKQAISKLLMMSGTDEDNDQNVSPEDVPAPRQSKPDPGKNHPAVIAAKEKKSAMDRAVALLKQIEPVAANWAAMIGEQFEPLKNKSASDLTKLDWQQVEEWADGIVNAQPASGDANDPTDETFGMFDGEAQAQGEQ